MKKIILFLLACAFSVASFGQLNTAQTQWNTIKNETGKGLNTATRVGNAGLAIIAGVRDTLQDFATLDTLSYYPKTSTLTDTLDYYYTMSEVNDTLSVYAKSADLSNYVTTNTTQTVTGTKTFTRINTDTVNAKTGSASLLLKSNGVEIKNQSGLTFLRITSNGATLGSNATGTIGVVQKNVLVSDGNSNVGLSIDTAEYNLNYPSLSNDKSISVKADSLMMYGSTGARAFRLYADTVYSLQPFKANSVTVGDRINGGQIYSPFARAFDFQETGFSYDNYNGSQLIGTDSDGLHFYTGQGGSELFALKKNEILIYTPDERNFLNVTAKTTTISRGDSIMVKQDKDSTTFYNTAGTTAAITIRGDSLNFYKNVTLKGDATSYDDLMMPFSTGTNGSNPYPTFNQDSLYWNFLIDTTGVTKCIMYMNVQLPHSWKEGTTVYPHIHYKHTTAQGTPTFKIKYKWYDTTGTIGVPWQWCTLSTTTGTTNNTVQMCDGGIISGVGKHISSMLVCQIYLTGQTGTGGINAYQFDVHFEKDGFGSNSLTSK